MRQRTEADSEATEAAKIPEKPREPKEPKEEEAVYTVAELKDAAASAFGERPEVVAGALKLAGKEAMTRTEAKAAIRTFLSRRV